MQRSAQWTVSAQRGLASRSRRGYKDRHKNHRLPLVGDGIPEAAQPLGAALESHRDIEAHGGIEGVGRGYGIRNGLRRGGKCGVERAAGGIAAHLHRVGFGGLKNGDGGGVVGLVVDGRTGNGFAGTIPGGKVDIERSAQMPTLK